MVTTYMYSTLCVVCFQQHKNVTFCSYTVLLAGEKPLRMSEISRKFGPLRDHVYYFTSNNFRFADFIDQPSHQTVLSLPHCNENQLEFETLANINNVRVHNSILHHSSLCAVEVIKKEKTNRSHCHNNY